MSAARLAEALDTLDDPAKGVVRSAHDYAYQHGSGILSSAHLLLGLLDAPHPTAASRVFDPCNLGTRGMDPQRSPESERVTATIRRRVEDRLGANIQAAPRLVHLPYTVHARAILIHAAAPAQRLRSEPTGIAEMWRALVHAPGSLAARCLDDLGVLSELQRGIRGPRE